MHVCLYVSVLIIYYINYINILHNVCMCVCMSLLIIYHINYINILHEF